MKILVIQTAFLGDVILATSVVEKLHSFYPVAVIDFLLRKGNEGVLESHPIIHALIILDKKKNKFSNLLAVSNKVRSEKYDCVINLHRFASSGFMVWRSNAKEKIGFDKNPFSFCYTKKVKHEIGTADTKKATHEIDRNQQLIAQLTDSAAAKPRLYPSAENFATVESLKSSQQIQQYVCLAPASVWFTKQLPREKWTELIALLPDEISVLLIGAASDHALCDAIRQQSLIREGGKQNKVINVAGQLSLLNTAALMKNAWMNYVNDSAPLHIASAMNAPTTAIFCSTVPAFGFGPLSEFSRVVETKEKLDCRPCGLHGHRQCPQEHFRCAHSIEVIEMLHHTK